MIEFTLWDIVRNLLLAARWTVLLSLVAFVGGGIVGFALLVLRLSPSRVLGRLVDGYVGLFQGTPLLMQLFVVYSPAGPERALRELPDFRLVPAGGG